MTERHTRYRIALGATAAVCLAIAVLSLFLGPADIPVAAVADILTGGGESEAWRYIVLHSRLPMAITAFAAGCGLSVAGLMLQTTFENPLAGPSVMGVSTGSALGVAIVTLGTAGLFSGLDMSVSQYTATFAGAAIGAALVILLLSALSAVVRNGVMLLIAGIMLSYLSSALITLLNFFAPSDDVKSYAVWGMGSFGACDLSASLVFLAVTFALCIWAFMLSKKMNVLLLGPRYAENLGYSVRHVRAELMCVSGALTAAATAFCGPIGFIGLIVPHIARMSAGTSDHFRLIPLSFAGGGAVALLCSLLSILPAGGIIPVNAITPVISVPVIIYIIVRRRQLKYLN